MYNKKRMFIGVAICGVLISCGKKDAPILPQVEKVSELSKADWLIGKWENNSEQGNLSESWSRVNDSVFSGKTHFIAGKDTMFTESIELLEKDGKLVYTATVSGENAGKPVSFPASSATSEKLVFENVGHDFPKKIVYTKVSADSIVADISGVEKGKPKSESFSMRRAK